MIGQVVVETDDFLADAKKAGLTPDERQAVIDHFATTPRAGDEIKGTGGARKVRFAGKGHGKSGGYRIISFYSGNDMPVFLMAVFFKGQKVDLTAAERNELKATLATFVEEYRRGVRHYVQSRKTTH